MPVKWKDISSYSQSQKEHVPHTFESRVGKFRLVVTRHILYPGQWVLRVQEVAEEIIDDCPVRKAQERLVKIFKKILTDALAGLK